MNDTVELNSRSAAALDDIVGDVQRINSPERMAWVWFVGKHLPDNDRFFPHGKWATLQRIEQQLEDAAATAVVMRERDNPGWLGGEGEPHD